MDLDRSIHERNAARKELDAIKELCNKLDIGNDKLNAEVNEYSEIKREVRHKLLHHKIVEIKLIEIEIA